MGAAGAALEREVGEVARRYGIRIFGPNTNTNAFEVLPEPPTPRGGRIGLVTQSGHQGRPLVQGTEFGVAFSRWVPTGNELDLEAADFIEYFAYDDDTAVIAGYFEGFKDPAKLRRALEAANAQGKPVVALKMGSTEAGTRMASSHTGHLAGSDAVVQGLFAQYGVVRVRDLDELLETAALFAKLPAGTGGRCGLYSISGGSGTLMAEVAESSGVPVPVLSARTQAGLRELIPDYLTVANPVDNGAQFLVSAPVEDRRRVFDLVAADPDIDVVVIGLTGALGRLTDRFAEDIVAFIDEVKKPIVVTWNSFKTDEQGFKTLVDAGVPLFRSFRNCFTALRAFAEYQRASSSFRPRKPLPSRLPKEAAAALTDAAGMGPSPLGADAVAAAARVLRHPPGRRGPGTLRRRGGAPRRRHRLPGSDEDRLARLPPQVRRRPRAPVGVVGGRSQGGLHRARRARHAGQACRAHRGGPDPGAGGGGHRDDRGRHPRPACSGPPCWWARAGCSPRSSRTWRCARCPSTVATPRRWSRVCAASLCCPGHAASEHGDVKALVDVVLAVARLAAACGDRLVELDLNPVVVRRNGVVAVDSLVVTAG